MNQRSWPMFLRLAFTVGSTLAAASVASAQGPNDKLPVYLDTTLAASSEDTCTPGFIWQGGGNPNTTFQRKTNLNDGVELGIKAILRGGADIRSTYVDGDGLVHIVVPAGEQILGNNRAKWNFTYSYNVTGVDNPPLSEYEAQLWVDVDASEKAKYLKLKLDDSGVPVSPACPGEPDLNGYQWKSGNTVLIGDDEGTSQVTQNSQNLGFGFYRSLIDGDSQAPGVQLYNFTPGQFDIQLSIKKSGTPWTILHVVIDVQ